MNSNIDLRPTSISLLAIEENKESMRTYWKRTFALLYSFERQTVVSENKSFFRKGRRSSTDKGRKIYIILEYFWQKNGLHCLLRYMLLGRVTDRVAEVVRGHGGPKSAFLGQKQCFLGRKCTITWYILHILLS